MNALKIAIDALSGARKLILCLILAIPVGVPLLLAGRIGGSDWKDIAVAAITAYCGSNVVEHAVTTLREHLAKAPSAEPQDAEKSEPVV